MKAKKLAYQGNPVTPTIRILLNITKPDQGATVILHISGKASDQGANEMPKMHENELVSDK